MGNVSAEDLYGKGNYCYQFRESDESCITSSRTFGMAVVLSIYPSIPYYGGPPTACKRRPKAIGIKVAERDPSS